MARCGDRRARGGGYSRRRAHVIAQAAGLSAARYGTTVAQVLPSRVITPANTSIPSQRFCSRMFSSFACWALSWFTIGSVISGKIGRAHV